MSKKTLTALTVLAVILIAGIAVALGKLYPRSEGKAKAVETGQFIEKHSLIEAVPSDAAIVFCFKDFGRACELLGDTLSVFGELASDKFDRIVKETYPSLRRAPAIMSVHYSKDMPPLLVVKTPQAANDSTANDCASLKAAADSAGLFHKVDGDLLLISSSETIINSSIRHIVEGHSILEAAGFAEIASQTPGSDIIFISNAYTDNILSTYFARKYKKYGSFIKELAEWTAFSVNKHSEGGVSMPGGLLYGSDHSYYMNVLRHAGAASVDIADAVPSQVDFIIDLPIGNLSAYIKAYRNYLDAKTRLDKYEYTLSKQKKASGPSAEDWARSIDIKEVALVGTHVDGKLRQLLLIKPGRKQSGEGLGDFSGYAGFTGTLFGDIFSGEDESTSAVIKGWIVAGAEDAVEEYSRTLDETLRERMSGNGLGDRIPQKGCGLWFYHSMTEDPNLIGTSFSPLLANGFRNVIRGVNYVPLTLSVMPKGEKMGLELNLARTNITKSKAPSITADRDTSLAVPSGPYKVRNSATGQINTLYQNSHLSICLKDENGKDLWGIPFKSRIRGYVKEVDLYNNGKLQYLFAADSKLYLLDRTGRFVGGFPVDLGKKIAVGPEVYDLKGNGDLSLVLLHKDNSIGMYDIKGKPSPSWKGITAPETIKALPELLKGNGKDFWVVRTGSQAMVYPLDGGEPIIKGEGKKMIRPDSKITVGDKGTFKATCYDGKERTFKLDKEKRKDNE